MIITFLSCKGGVGKTTSSIHVAAFLQGIAATLLVDGDQNRSCLDWADRSGRLPFKVCDERQGVKLGGKYEWVVIDTAARPSPADLKEFADGCDLLIVPTTPDALSLAPTLELADSLKALKAKYKILLTRVHPAPSKAGIEAKAALMDAGLPVFNTHIRAFRAFEIAALQGCIVSQATQAKNRGLAWQCYQRLGEEILHEF